MKTIRNLIITLLILGIVAVSTIALYSDDQEQIIDTSNLRQIHQVYRSTSPNFEMCRKKCISQGGENCGSPRVQGCCKQGHCIQTDSGSMTCERYTMITLGSKCIS